MPHIGDRRRLRRWSTENWLPLSPLPQRAAPSTPSSCSRHEWTGASRRQSQRGFFGFETSASTGTSLLTSDQRDLKSTAMATPSEVGITCQRALSMDNQEALSDLEWAVGVEVWPIYEQPVSCTTSVQSPYRLETCLAAHRAQAVRAWCDHEACLVHLKCSLALVRFSAATLTSRLKTACGIHAKHVAALAAGCWSVPAAGARRLTQAQYRSMLFRTSSRRAARQKTKCTTL